MNKQEWVVFSIIMILGTLIIAMVGGAIYWVQYEGSVLKSKEELKKPKPIAAIYSKPVEADTRFSIQREFKRRYNVLEIVDAHALIQPEMDRLIAEGASETQIRSKLLFLIDAYVEQQTKQVAREVLMEYAPGYSQWDVQDLMSLANNDEKKHVLMLFELQYLKSKGIEME